MTQEQHSLLDPGGDEPPAPPVTGSAAPPPTEPAGPLALPPRSAPPVTGPVTGKTRRGAETFRRRRRWGFAPGRVRWRSAGYALAVVALLAEMAVAMVTTAVEQTPTIDEPVYVGTAVVYLQQHSLRYNPEHPPLGKLIIAAGLVFADARLDPALHREPDGPRAAPAVRVGQRPVAADAAGAAADDRADAAVRAGRPRVRPRSHRARRAGWWRWRCTRSRRTSSPTDRWPRSTCPRPASC